MIREPLPLRSNPGKGRLAFFLLLYVLVVPFTAMAAELLAGWLWPHLAGLIAAPPWPGGGLPEELGGPIGADHGLFALRGLANLLLTLMVTALFQRVLWQGDRRLGHLGLQGRRAWAELGLGLALGASAMLLVYLILRGAGWVTWPQPAPPAHTPQGSAVPAIVLGFSCLAAQEELVARGFLLQNLARGWGLPLAVLLQAALFGLAHLANPHAGLASTVGIFAAGIFLGAAFVRTGRLWLPTGAHIAWNLVEGPVLGLPLSGLRTSRFFHTELTGPAAATGGAFGPEAGWVAVVVLLAFALGLGRGAWHRRPD